MCLCLHLSPACFQFATGAVNATQPVKDPDFALRSVAMQLYYAQQAFAAVNHTHSPAGRYTADLGTRTKGEAEDREEKTIFFLGLDIYRRLTLS